MVVVCGKCSGEKNPRSASASIPMLDVQEVEHLLKLVGNPGKNDLWLCYQIDNYLGNYQIDNYLGN